MGGRTKGRAFVKLLLKIILYLQSAGKIGRLTDSCIFIMPHLQVGNVSKTPKYLEQSPETRYKWVNNHQKAHALCSLGGLSALTQSFNCA